MNSHYVAFSLHGLKIYRFPPLDVGLILSKSMCYIALFLRVTRKVWECGWEIYSRTFSLLMFTESTRRENCNIYHSSRLRDLIQLPERACLPSLALLRHLPENCKNNIAVQPTATAKYQLSSQECLPGQMPRPFPLGPKHESYGSRCLPPPFHLLWSRKAKPATQRHQFKIRESCPIAPLVLSCWNLSPCLPYPQ